MHSVSLLFIHCVTTQSIQIYKAQPLPQLILLHTGIMSFNDFSHFSEIKWYYNAINLNSTYWIYIQIFTKALNLYFEFAAKGLCIPIFSPLQGKFGSQWESNKYIKYVKLKWLCSIKEFQYLSSHDNGVSNYMFNHTLCFKLIQKSESNPQSHKIGVSIM